MESDMRLQEVLGAGLRNPTVGFGGAGEGIGRA